MRSIRLRSFFVAVATFFAVAGPAAADRPTCEDLLSARAVGQSVEQVAADFRTTTVRVEACERVAEQHKRLDAQRAQFEAAHSERLAR